MINQSVPDYQYLNPNPPIVVRMRRGFLPNLSLSPPTTGLARNWRKEKMEPRNPPNSTVLNWGGAPTILRNTSTYKWSNGYYCDFDKLLPYPPVVWRVRCHHCPCSELAGQGREARSWWRLEKEDLKMILLEMFSPSKSKSKPINTTRDVLSFIGWISALVSSTSFLVVSISLVSRVLLWVAIVYLKWLSYTVLQVGEYQTMSPEPTM